MGQGEGELETVVGNVGIGPSSHHASGKRRAGRSPESGSDTEGGHCFLRRGVVSWRGRMRTRTSER